MCGILATQPRPEEAISSYDRKPDEGSESRFVSLLRDPRGDYGSWPHWQFTASPSTDSILFCGRTVYWLRQPVYWLLT